MKFIVLPFIAVGNPVQWQDARSDVFISNKFRIILRMNVMSVLQVGGMTVHHMQVPAVRVFRGNPGMGSQ